MVIGIYPRKSVYRDNSESVATQIKLCKEYAEIVYRGQPIEYMVYEKDEGFSGKSVHRPSYQQLMSDVRDGLLDVVMVYKLDRISRNVQDFSNTFAVFQEHGVSFVSVKESFDTSTPIGRTVMYILAAFAQLERENTSERVTDSMLEMAKSGFWTGGRCPAGMRSIRKTTGGKEHSFLEVDEDTIPLVRELFRLFLSGMSVTALERYCRNHSIRTLRGKFMSTSQIHFILTNPVYCRNDADALAYFQEKGYGLPEHAEKLFDGTRGLISYGRKAGSSSPYTIALGIHEPVISGSDWVAAQRRMGINKMYHTSKYEAGLLKGVIRCPCGSRMNVKVYLQKGTQYRSYLCAVRERRGIQYCNSHHINMDRVDDLFLKRLRQLRFDKSQIVLQEEQETFFFDEKAALQRKAELQQKIRNLMEVLSAADGQASAKYVLLEINRLDHELQILESDILRGRRQNTEAERRQNTVDSIHKQICYLLDHFDELEYKEKNELIRRMVKKCVFDGEKLDVFF